MTYIKDFLVPVGGSIGLFLLIIGISFWVKYDPRVCLETREEEYIRPAYNTTRIAKWGPKNSITIFYPAAKKTRIVCDVYEEELR